MEINGGSTIDWVNGGRASSDIYFPSYGPNPGDIPPSDNLTVTANSTANGNEVVIKGGSTGGEVDGGDAAVSIHIPADFDSDLGVLIFSPTIVNGTATATTNDNRVIIEESTIGEGIDAGSADIYVSATDVSGTTATALAKNNTIEINGSSTVVKDEILAGDSHISGNFSSASTSTAEGNGVIINDGTVEIENDAIVGGVAEIGGSDYGYSDSYGNTAEMHIPDNGGSAAATGNSVAINGGTVTVRKVYHGDSEDDDYVGIVGGAAESETGSATATYNTVAITGGDVKAEGYGIVGGWAGSSSGDATAMHNTVEISGGTVEGDIYGGYADLHHVLLEHPGDYNSSDASPTATNNKVKVQNSTMENVTGGNAIRFEYQTVEAGDYEINYSSSATANSNQVEIGAGDIVRNVTGGDSTVALQLFPLGGPAPFTPFDGNVAITATTHSTANSNQVKVTGGTAGDVIAGYTDVYINTLTNYHYSSGEVETDIIGTIDGILTATANENKVIVEGGTIEDVLGGDASATAIGRDASDFTATSIAKNNKVEINGDNTVVVAEKLANPAKNL